MLFVWMLAGALFGRSELRQDRAIRDEFIDNQVAGAIWFALVGVALALLMVLRPQGIFGKRSEVLFDAR